MTGKLEALELWRSVLVTNVRRAGPDLTARQLALLLTVYLTAPPHTVRGLAQTLSVSKPAISRALDRLGRLGFLRRKRDETDRRNVLIQRTVKGSVYLTEFAHLVEDARDGRLRLDGAAAWRARSDAPAGATEPAGHGDAPPAGVSTEPFPDSFTELAAGLPGAAAEPPAALAAGDELSPSSGSPDQSLSS